MDDVRVYGDVHGLSPEGFERLRGDIPFDQVEYRDRVLRVDHEGMYIDVEDFIEAVRREMDPDGWAHVDFIDHVDWVVHRYVISKEGVQVKNVAPDAVLEAGKDEYGA